MTPTAQGIDAVDGCGNLRNRVTPKSYKHGGASPYRLRLGSTRGMHFRGLLTGTLGGSRQRCAGESGDGSGDRPRPTAVAASGRRGDGGDGGAGVAAGRRRRTPPNGRPMSRPAGWSARTASATSTSSCRCGRTRPRCCSATCAGTFSAQPTEEGQLRPRLPHADQPGVDPGRLRLFRHREQRERQPVLPGDAGRRAEVGRLGLPAERLHPDQPGWRERSTTNSNANIQINGNTIQMQTESQGREGALRV